MRFDFGVRLTTVCLITGALTLPCPAIAATPGVRDVMLSPEGLLRGVVVGASGTPVVHVQVSARDTAGRETRVESDSAGRFALGGLHGGVYQLAATGRPTIWRVWTAEAAPPAASATALLVTDDATVRGQRPASALLTDHPLLPALIVAAAIAIPIAVNNSRSDRPFGS